LTVRSKATVDSLRAAVLQFPGPSKNITEPSYSGSKGHTSIAGYLPKKKKKKKKKNHPHVYVQAPEGTSDYSYHSRIWLDWNKLNGEVSREGMAMAGARRRATGDRQSFYSLAGEMLVLSLRTMTTLSRDNRGR